MSRRVPLLSLAMSLFVAASLRAQDPTPTGNDPDPEQKVYLRGVEVRQPDAMRSGDTIQLVGMEQGTNSFRAKTPVLSMGDCAPKLLDPDALYQARMAMYGEPGYAPAAAPGAEMATGASAARPAVPPEEPSGGPSVPMILLAAGVLCGAAVLLRRLRQTRDA